MAFYTLVSNEGFLFKIGLLRHAQPRKPKNEARHYSLLQMRKSAIHAEACYYSIATNEACHYSKLSQMRHSFNKLLVFEATLVR
jgi:hypothetical protein